MRTILIVEDETFLQDIYKTKFESEGFTVFLAADIKEAMRQSVEQKPDIILLDILLRDENGLAFLRQKKMHHAIKDIPTIAFSNFDDETTKKDALKLGVLDYILKTNYTPDDLIAITKTRIK